MKSVFVLLIMLFIGSFSVTAGAAGDIYAGMGVGSASYSVDLGVDGNFEESSTGTKLYIGYDFNKYLAAEFAAYNFAEASVGAFELSPGGPVISGGSASMKGAAVYAVGMYPVSKKINLLAKLGMLNWDADLSANGNSRTNDGSDMAYALAASYAFTKELLAVAEWESFQTDNPELSLFSVGFKFIFK